MTFDKIETLNFKAVKRAFVTRNVNIKDAKGFRSDLKPRNGDLCVARVKKLGHHQRIEQTDGRRARMFPGDLIIVAYSNRYATDQFEGKVPEEVEPCSLVAAGGIAATLLSRHGSTKKPTAIEPLGILCREDGSAINVMDYALPKAAIDRTVRPHMALVVGSGMNAGKTTTVAAIVRVAKRAGLKVGAIKITGTGAGGDLWFYKDSGAKVTIDFTDAGHAATVGLNLSQLQNIADTLYAEAAKSCDIIIAEIADGLFQTETDLLMKSPRFQNMVDSVLFASGDPMGALAGVRHLRALGLTPSAVSGALTASDLAAREAAAATGLPALTLSEFEKNEKVLSLIMKPAKPTKAAAPVGIKTGLGLAKDFSHEQFAAII